MHSSIFVYCILWVSCLWQNSLSPWFFEACAEVLAFICFICCCFERKPRFYSCIIVVSYFKFIWLLENKLTYLKRNILHLCFPYALSLFCIAAFRENVKVCIIVPSSSVRFFSEEYSDRIRSMTEQNLIRLTSLFALWIKWTFSLKCSEGNPANMYFLFFFLSDFCWDTSLNTGWGVSHNGL